jgi:hypothetical protein
MLPLSKPNALCSCQTVQYSRPSICWNCTPSPWFHLQGIENCKFPSIIRQNQRFFGPHLSSKVKSQHKFFPHEKLSLGLDFLFWFENISIFPFSHLFIFMYSIYCHLKYWGIMGGLGKDQTIFFPAQGCA